MRIFKRLTIFILIILVLLMGCASANSRIINAYLFGDADGDNELTILDSTRIQRKVADLTDISDKFQLYAADIDHDDLVTVMDATKIQRILCELDEQSMEEKYYVDDISILCLYADHDSGRAYVGDTVRFCVEATAPNLSPIRYKYLINGETVQDGLGLNELEYTFTEAGNYYIEAYAYNRFGKETVEYGKFRVYPSDKRPETLYMTGKHFDVSSDDPFSENTRDVSEHYSRKRTVTINCSCGTAPYQYSFDFNNGEQISGFSDNNSFDIYGLKIEENSELLYTEYPLVVTIRDSEGEEITETITIRVVTPRVG